MNRFLTSDLHLDDKSIIEYCNRPFKDEKEMNEVLVENWNSVVNNGDMVINIGHLKDKRYDEITEEIKQIKTVIGDKILKVIIETCLLTDEEKIKMCHIVTEAKADYIKTSTGFSTSGATPHDIELFANNVGKDVKIKAAGGIATLEDAEQFLNLGATRLGTSRIIKLVKNQTATGY